MRSLSFLLLGGMVVVVVAGAVYYLGTSSARRHADTQTGTQDPAHPNAEPNAVASEEVQRLRAEVRKRDEMLASLLAQTRAAKDASAPVVAAPQTPPSHPGDRAVDVLDERMYTAPKDPARAAEMERAIREVAGSPALARAKIASLHCGSTLCKVILTAENGDGGNVNESMAALGSSLPKLFGAAAVHRTSDGESAMYLARSGEDLSMTAR
jgi:hypothetical protein